MLVHQLPASPSNLRVRTWRRLQELGAVALKQSVYVLPDSPTAREDFEWLKIEIEGSGGEASVFVADSIDAAADTDLVEEFRRSRQAAYSELAAEIQRANRASARKSKAPQGRRDLLARFRQRLAAIEKTDYFGAAGRDRVLALLTSRDGDTSAGSGASEAATAYAGRVWVTRPLPGVDRMASAWLIRRFIDRTARFEFATDTASAPSNSVTFDMFGGEFTHRGQLCTFEHLCSRFGIDDPAVRRLGEIVHDIDLKDDKFGAPEVPTVAATIDGLQLSCADDQALLDQGHALFEALYRSFSQQKPGPQKAQKAQKLKTTRKK